MADSWKFLADLSSPVRKFTQPRSLLLVPLALLANKFNKYQEDPGLGFWAGAVQQAVIIHVILEACVHRVFSSGAKPYHRLNFEFES